MSLSLYSALMNPILLVMTMYSKLKPTNLTFMILSSSITTNIFMNIQTNNKWFPLILTLLFSGGIMILFSFFSTILPNVKTPNYKINMTLLLLPLLIFISNKKTPTNLSTQLAQNMYNKEPTNFLILTTIALLLTLNIKSHTIKMNSPLKSSN